MAVYTDVSDQDLEAFLGGFALGRPVAFKGIAEGVENSNYLLETELGRYILTLFERRVRPDDLPYFLDLMTFLADRGYPCARPITDRKGAVLNTLAGRPAVIVAFLPGLSARRPSVAQCRQAGVGLGWLHRAGADFARCRVNPLGLEAWRNVASSLSDRAEALKPGLAKLVAADLEALQRTWPRDLPQGVVHADWFPDNVFFNGGAFAGAIDFYFAADDLLAYDIGVALNAWCFEADGSFNVTASAALISGYESRRTLSAAERDALPVLARGAAMRFFLTRLADWGDERAGALVRPKDPLEYERKLAIHRAGLDMIF
ncbi:MAG TPA: homoserine kinase [Caulobacteraceae bacterium]|jgi:homoserine kinase type II